MLSTHTPEEPKIASLVRECQQSTKIVFVNVLDEFEGHEAYSEIKVGAVGEFSTAWLNPIMVLQSQDLKGTDDITLKRLIGSLVSAYSMHPNATGAQAYADLVNAKIRSLENSKQDDADKKGTRSISGIITAAGEDTDMKNNSPLAGANIQLDWYNPATVGPNPSYSTISDDDGNYRISDVVAGKYNITVSKDGYQTVTDVVTISDEEATYYNVALIKDSKQPDEEPGNITWTLDANGTLTISGTGPMTGYEYGVHAPWYEQRDAINTVVIGNGVTSIGDYAFEYCEKLTSLTIPNSVVSIGHDAFHFCKSLTSLTIPNSVISIRAGTFNYCYSLTDINVTSGNPAFCSVDGVLFSADQTLLHTYPTGKNAQSYSIPTSVTTIGGYAFTNCLSLTSMTIPNSVTTIEHDAFSSCSNLTSVTIPDSVTSLGSHTFNGCGLTSVTIPSNITTIEAWVFANCHSLTSVTIPKGVTSIGSAAFANCSGLTSVTIPESVTSIGAYAFMERSSLTDVYYGGNESQWKQISIDSSAWFSNPDENANTPLLNATIHYNST